MVNVKDQVYQALLSATAGMVDPDNVTDTYPSQKVQFPVIVYKEEQNSVYERVNRQGKLTETKSRLSYKIDIWGTDTTSPIALAIDQHVGAGDDNVTGLGLVRDGCQDIDEPGGIKHKQMRYIGIIDTATQQIYDEL